LRRSPGVLPVHEAAGIVGTESARMESAAEGRAGDARPAKLAEPTDPSEREECLLANYAKWSSTGGDEHRGAQQCRVILFGDQIRSSCGYCKYPVRTQQDASTRPPLRSRRSTYGAVLHSVPAIVYDL